MLKSKFYYKKYERLKGSNNIEILLIVDNNNSNFSSTGALVLQQSVPPNNITFSNLTSFEKHQIFRALFHAYDC